MSDSQHKIPTGRIPSYKKRKQKIEDEEAARAIRAAVQETETESDSDYTDIPCGECEGKLTVAEAEICGLCESCLHLLAFKSSFE